jgi:hypothetical protein
MKRFLRFLLGFSAGLLVIALALIGLIWLLFGGSSTFKLESSTWSPDGRYQAVVAASMGGGAAGWCSLDVLVLPKSVPFEAETDQSAYRVARLRCDDPSVSWEGPNLIVISLKHVPPYEQTPIDRSGLVSVRYLDGA